MSLHIINFNFRGGVFMVLEDALSPYCEALQKGIESENWPLSLMAAFTLPDICISLEGKKNGDNYAEWFNTYVDQYNIRVSRRQGMENVNTLDDYLEMMKEPLKPQDVETTNIIFFTGVNAYALRCAFLHNGDGEIEEQRIQIKRPEETLGISKVMIDKNEDSIFRQDGNIAFLNPKIYCESILSGVKKWIDKNERNTEVLNSTGNLIFINK